MRVCFTKSWLHANGWTDGDAVGEAFHLRYTRLPGAAGDEVWRTSARGVIVDLFEDGRGSRRCVLIGQGMRACSPTEIALREPLPTSGWGGLGAKLLLSEPYAIDEKQIGELHCNSA